MYTPPPSVVAVAGGAIPLASTRVTVAPGTGVAGPPHVEMKPVTWAAAAAVSGRSTDTPRRVTRRIASASIPRRARTGIRGSPQFTQSFRPIVELVAGGGECGELSNGIEVYWETSRTWRTEE